MSTRTGGVCLSATLILSLCLSAVAGDLAVKLVAREDAGVNRTNEPVTCGVPFPKGLVKDVAELVLLGPDEKPVPAAFTATCLWPDDKSVRWALIDTQVSVAAKGAAEFTIATGKPAASAIRVEVDEKPDSIRVKTPFLVFDWYRGERGSGFRLMDSGWRADDKGDVFAYGMNVGKPSDGLSMTVDGVKFTSDKDRTCKVVVEEQNPMRATILASGKLTDADGKTGYDYQVRVHVFAGSPVVKVVPTIIKKFGARRDINHRFSDLSFTVKGVPLAAYALGGDGEPATGTLGATDKASVVVKDSTRWEFGGVAKGAGDPKKTKPLSLGWAGLSGETGGVAVGVYRFWQTHPKAIELSGDGSITVGLMPASAGKPQDFYTGMARTHEVLLYFHGKEAPADVQKKFIAFQRPLFLAASPEWYARSGAFGSIAPAGAKMASDAATQEVKKLDDRISGYFDELLTTRRDEWKGRRGVTMDTYGWLAFGDTLHWVWDEEPVTSPWAIAWDSNYYDLPHVAALYFARTGERKYFDYFTDHTWHLMDIDVIHWDPEFKQGGTSRRCPATNHVGFDPPNHREPVVNAAYDHHKSESVWERYYLLGDRRALEVANDLLGHALRFDIPENQMTGRRVGHRLSTLVAGYWHTGEKKYLDKARQVIDIELKRQEANNGWHGPKVDFTCGVAMEGIAKYYQVTGDKVIFDAMRKAADWLVERPDQQRYSNLVFFVAAVYQGTGEKKYLDLAASLFNKGKPGHLSKDMGVMYRNAPNATGCLAAKE